MFEAASLTARYALAVFRQADEAFTRESLAKFAASLPRSSRDVSGEEWLQTFSFQVLRRATDRWRETGDAECFQAVRYFADRFPSKTSFAQEMLISAFVGVLSVPFDSPPVSAATPEPKPGPAASFARPRLGRLWRAMILLRQAKPPY